MAQAFDYFGDSKDALRMLIPVMINEKNIHMVIPTPDGVW